MNIKQIILLASTLLIGQSSFANTDAMIDQSQSDKSYSAKKNSNTFDDLINSSKSKNDHEESVTEIYHYKKGNYTKKVTYRNGHDIKIISCTPLDNEKKSTCTISISTGQPQLPIESEGILLN